MPVLPFNKASFRVSDRSRERRVRSQADRKHKLRRQPTKQRQALPVVVPKLATTFQFTPDQAAAK
ncbi:MAG: hypothetical protein P8P70_07840, partial [Sulfitobacter sp.]|nr:hypothetical protein [Sulfitobacter sp.]